jgi:hypothetical protein
MSLFAYNNDGTHSFSKPEFPLEFVISGDGDNSSNNDKKLHGHICSFFVNENMEIKDIVFEAIKNNNISMLYLVHLKNLYTFSDIDAEYAIETCQLAILKWMLGIANIVGSIIGHKNGLRGPLFIMKWLATNYNNNFQTNVCMRVAAFFGNLMVMKWVKEELEKENGETRYIFRPDVADAAMKKGHVHVLEWLFYGGLGVRYTYAAIRYAHSINNKKVIDWLNSH